VHIGEKGEFTFTRKYDEIVVPERISYRADSGQTMKQVIAEFFEQGSRTKVVLTQNGFPDGVSCNIVSQGTLESLDKLDSALTGQVLMNRP